jgi:PAS domain S-box-containing protein
MNPSEPRLDEHPGDIPALCRYMVEGSPLAMVATAGSEHELRYANLAFCRLYGKPREQLIGHAFAEAVPESGSDGSLEMLDRVYRSGETESAADLEQSQAEPGPAYWSYAVWPVLDDQERPKGLLIQVTDTTERVQARVLVERATRMAAEINEALVITGLKAEALTEKLADADRAKDQFLAMLAHELRNPLAPIMTALRLMRESGGDEAVLQRAIEIVERQVRHEARLIDDLLDIARITQDKIALRKEPVDLATLIEDVIQANRPLIEARGHELSVSLPAEPVWLEADPIRVTQLLGNLLNNAAKYTDPGGHLWLSAAREGDEGDVPDGAVIVRVRDTGVGISPENLPHIFDMFTQASRSLDQSHGGLGIGLSLARRIAELHGGSVDAASAGAGRGSEFVVRLPAGKRPGAHPERSDAGSGPVAPPAPARGPAPAAVRSAAGCPPAAETSGGARRRRRAPRLPRLRRREERPRRILVVDDNVDAAETLAELLALWGHDVWVAHSGSEAIEAGRASRPEVILLDLNLDETDGCEVARRLGDEALLNGVLLVAVTGYGQEADRRRSQEAGFHHHLTKPVDLDALRALIVHMTDR